MPNNEAEGVPCSFAEIGAMESDLNVCVLSNELNILVKAPYDATNYALYSFIYWILFVSNLLVLVNDIFEDNSDKSYQCNQEGSHCNRSDVIPHGPSESHVYTDLTSSIGHFLSLSRVVPHASERSNHKLLNANDEGDNPEESEEIKPEHVLSFFFPFNRGDERVWSKHWGSDTIKVDGTSGPNNENWDDNKVGNNRKGNDS